MSHEEIEAALARLPEPDLTDPDNPEWTTETFARAKRVEDLEPDLREKIFAAFPNTKWVERPNEETPKLQVKLRLDADLVSHFKAAGPGWQTRINAALREAIAKR